MNVQKWLNYHIGIHQNFGTGAIMDTAHILHLKEGFDTQYSDIYPDIYAHDSFRMSQPSIR